MLTVYEWETMGIKLVKSRNDFVHEKGVGTLPG